MTISVTVTAESPQALHTALLTHAAYFAPSAAPAPANDTPGGVSAIVAAGEGPKKRGPKPRIAPTGEPAGEPVQTDIEDHIAASGPVISPQPIGSAVVTHDDMVAALSKVNGEFGIQRVRDVLKPFGAAKVGEVKAEDRAAVIEAAQKIVA